MRVGSPPVNSTSVKAASNGSGNDWVLESDHATQQCSAKLSDQDYNVKEAEAVWHGVTGMQAIWQFGHNPHQESMQMVQAIHVEWNIQLDIVCMAPCWVSNTVFITD